MSASTAAQSEEGKTVQLTEEMNQNYFPALLSKADSASFCSSLWSSPVQPKARLPLDYKLMGSERLRVNRDCVFPRYPQRGLQSWAQHGRGEGQEENQQEKASRASPLPSLPFQVGGWAKEEEIKQTFCQAELWCNGSWKKAGLQRESLGILRAGCDFNILISGESRLQQALALAVAEDGCHPSISTGWFCSVLGWSHGGVIREAGGGWGACLGFVVAVSSG